MTVPETPGIEGTGAKFDRATYLDVRDRTRAAVGAIAAQLGTGMTEEEAREAARATLTSLGLRRGWHRTIVRCGPNTVLGFSERSRPGVVLGEDDIFFVDIGPVAGDHEGDAGDTFVLGDDPLHLRAQRDVREIWEAVRAVWLSERLTGTELYRRATALTEGRGWILNRELSGHRLSDFPHAVHYRGALADADVVPTPDLWVLEIAIVHPDRTFGAFYEDLLLDDGAAPGSTEPG